VSLYETDFVKWAEEQATLLTERRFDLLDLENLIEEVDELAGRHRDTLQSQMQRLLVHLLKLTYTTGSREPEQAWRRCARNARDEIDKLMNRGGRVPTLADMRSRPRSNVATRPASHAAASCTRSRLSPASVASGPVELASLGLDQGL
jgi:hypothetical protein